MQIDIPEEVFGVKKWEATVVSNYNVASFIKEFIVEVPEDMPYEAGGYIQIEMHLTTRVPFQDIDITAHPDEHGEPEKFKMEWDKFGLWPLSIKMRMMLPALTLWLPTQLRDERLCSMFV